MQEERMEVEMQERMEAEMQEERMEAEMQERMEAEMQATAAATNRSNNELNQSPPASLDSKVSTEGRDLSPDEKALDEYMKQARQSLYATMDDTRTSMKVMSSDSKEKSKNMMARNVEAMEEELNGWKKDTY